LVATLRPGGPMTMMTMMAAVIMMALIMMAVIMLGNRVIIGVTIR
jgi:hypothetical protein